MEMARTKAEQTKAVAAKAHSDAAIARRKETEFEHIELHVGTYRCALHHLHIEVKSDSI